VVRDESHVAALLEGNGNVLVQIHADPLFLFGQPSLRFLHVLDDAVLCDKLLGLCLVKLLSCCQEGPLEVVAIDVEG